MAATPHPAATDAAIAILRQGGNAIDAAVAAAFALSVVETYHSGLGGGEFAVVWDAKEGKAAALDARECAPAASTKDMFLNPKTGRPDGDKSTRGGLAAGVPGSVAGRVELNRVYGRLPLKAVIAPAVTLAREGFKVDRYLADRLVGSREGLKQFGADAVFFRNGGPSKRGEILVQSALANTLERIGEDGGKAFYGGADAQNLVRACRKAGGVISADDLSHYRVIWRDPIGFEYRGYQVFSMPPPSSGGVCLAMIMNILEGFPLSYLGEGDSETIHLMASAFEAAFADRAKYLGDPDFAPQPVTGMTSKEYTAQIRDGIDRHHRTPVAGAGDPWQYGEHNTSHISVIDREGNMCALTTSVNTAFGSLVFVPELGIFLNSTMDDFSIAPTDTNNWSLITGEANRIAPNKRPLSSMSPTVVLKDGKPFLCLGSVGGPRIITSVAEMMVNVIDFKMDVQAAVDAPRFHQQWRPDLLYVEREISPETIAELRERGWNVEAGGNWSISQAVMYESTTGDFYGAADARGVGTAGPSAAP